ncbi:substrate-binding domain-containing protein, partial [Rhizobium ruizarguesonis]
PVGVLPAVRRSVYSDRAPSLVASHLEALLKSGQRPDAILCGNDRVAMEVYAALARACLRIPDDIAVRQGHRRQRRVQPRGKLDLVVEA